MACAEDERGNNIEVEQINRGSRDLIKFMAS